jgi:hypothetical protein
MRNLEMSYASKNKTGLCATLIVVAGLMAFAAWQFYQFVTFRTSAGLFDSQGGQWHLWAAIVATGFACFAGFFVLSAFVSHDTDDDLHITSRK